MLLSAAAARWNVDVARLRTRAGTVIGPAGRKASYGELAEAAMALPVPEKVTLKDPKDFRIIGRATTRIDAKAKSSGRQDFGIDVRQPGQLTAVVARPPVFGAKLTTVGDAAARAVHGTASETAARMLVWPRLQPLLSKYPDIKIEISSENRFIDIVAERFDIGVRLGGRGQGHDRGAHGAGHAHGGGRKPWLFRAPPPASHAAGSRRTRLHLSAPADPRCTAALGIQAPRKNRQCPGHGAPRVQRDRLGRCRDDGRARARLGACGCRQ
jgi:hypothetical protein